MIICLMASCRRLLSNQREGDMCRSSFHGCSFSLNTRERTFISCLYEKNCKAFVGLMTGITCKQNGHLYQYYIQDCIEEGKSEVLDYFLCFCPTLARTRTTRYLVACQFKSLEEDSKLKITVFNKTDLHLTSQRSNGSM